MFYVLFGQLYDNIGLLLFQCLVTLLALHFVL